MRAKLIRKTTEGFPESDPKSYGIAEMATFTLGEMYEVIAVYQVEYRAYLLLSDDFGGLANRLAYSFELESKTIPEDWKINIISAEHTIIMGPEFLINPEDIAKLLDKDDEMIEKLQDYFEKTFI